MNNTINQPMLPAGFIDAVVEAAAILGAVDPDHAPKNMRWPLADELDGFLGMINAAPQAQPAPEIAMADAYRAGVDSGIAAEREACAELCSDIDGGENMFSRAIRARGNT